MATPTSPTRAARLLYLDGIRGLASLYVLVFHAVWQIPEGRLSRWPSILTAWLLYGHYAVAVFIVLSGFVLAIQLDPEGSVRAGYFRRRATRILPPYYAALAMSLLLIAVIPSLQSGRDPRWAVALPAFGIGPIASHLALVHNMKKAWLFAIDPPLWSVATEWQIYFAFPVMAWIWRRWGTTALLGLAFFAGLLPGNLFSVTPNQTGACPWYLGLFALGMLAAGRVRGFDRPDRFSGFAPVAMLACLALATGDSLPDAFVGATTAALLAWLSRSPDAPRFRAILESRPLLALGSFSYSLYAVHYPFLVIAYDLCSRSGLSPDRSLAAMIFIACPPIVGLAYLFSLAFERPFMRHAPKTLARAEVVAAMDPAP